MQWTIKLKDKTCWHRKFVWFPRYFQTESDCSCTYKYEWVWLEYLWRKQTWSGLFIYSRTEKKGREA